MFDVMEFIKSQNITYMGNIEGDQAHVRVMSGLVEINGKLAFVTNSTKDVYQELIDNPKIEFCMFDKGSVVRVAGPVRHDKSQEAIDAYLAVQPGVAAYYGGGTEQMAVMVFEEAVAYVSSKDLKDEIVLY